MGVVRAIGDDTERESGRGSGLDQHGHGFGYDGARYVVLGVSVLPRHLVHVTHVLLLISVRNLYSTFITPFSDPAAAQAVEPDYHVPSCYIVQTPPAGPAKASMFSEETLLFMFYAAPRDALQEVAAQELCVLLPSICLRHANALRQVQQELAVPQGASCLADKGHDDGDGENTWW